MKITRVLEVARDISPDSAQLAFGNILKSYNSTNSWFFKMQGRENGQSFHEQQTASDSFVNPMTLRVRPRDAEREDLRSTELSWIQGIPKVPSALSGLPAFEGWGGEVSTISKTIKQAETSDEIKGVSLIAKEAVIKAGVRRSLAAMMSESASTGSTALAKAMDHFDAAESVLLKGVLIKTVGRVAYSAIEGRIQNLWITDTEKHLAYGIANSRMMQAMSYGESLVSYYQQA